MPQINWNLGWLNQNSLRNYPLADSATGVDTTGAFHVPRDFVVGLSIPVNTLGGSDPSRFFVRQITSYVSGFSVTVAYDSSAGSSLSPPVDVGSVSVTRVGHTRDKTYPFIGTGGYYDSLGSCTIGQLDGIDLQPSGLWNFTFDAGRLDPDAIRPLLRGVSSLSVNNGTGLVGDVGLMEGTNIRLSVVTQAGQQYIRIDAISGEGLNQDCSCDDTPLANAPITSINGRGGLSSNFEVFPGNCISITPVENGIKIDNTCSKPCCGCPELEKITADLAVVMQQLYALENFVRPLQTSVTTMNQVVLGSKLNDGGCTS